MTHTELVDEGIERLELALERGPTAGIGRDLKRRALQVQRAAKRLAPVDTGRLRASIVYGLDRDRRGLYAWVGSDVEYSLYQELGTERMSAHPFLRPALTAAAAERQKRTRSTRRDYVDEDLGRLNYETGEFE